MNIAALLGGSVQIAGGGPVSIEARLRGVKLTILGNPLPWLASNLVVHPDIKGIPDLPGKLAGISRFGSSTDQGFRYLFRKEQSSLIANRSTTSNPILWRVPAYSLPG